MNAPPIINENNRHNNSPFTWFFFSMWFYTFFFCFSTNFFISFLIIICLFFALCFVHSFIFLSSVLWRKNEPCIMGLFEQQMNSFLFQLLFRFFFFSFVGGICLFVNGVIVLLNPHFSAEPSSSDVNYVICRFIEAFYQMVQGNISLIMKMERLREILR